MGNIINHTSFKNYPSYADANSRESLNNVIDQQIRHSLVESLYIMKKEYDVSFITNVINFFNLDYATGSEILSLMSSSLNDTDDNKKVALGMLFGSVKESIKQEIIKEIFK